MTRKISALAPCSLCVIALLISLRVNSTEMLPAEAAYPCNASPASSLAIPIPGWQLTWENDSIIGPYGSDQFYTQGLQFGYRYKPGDEPFILSRLMRMVCNRLPQPTDDGSRDLSGAGSLFFGQHFFTPGDITNPDRIPDDRPYAAWLYVGARVELAQTFEHAPWPIRHGLFHSLELQLGTTGRPALGGWVQKRWHQVVPAPRPAGWQHQLPQEFGVQGSYSARGLLLSLSGGSSKVVQLQGTANAALSLGTIQVNGEMGTTWRIGRNLGDPVPRTLVPELLSPEAAEAISPAVSYRVESNLAQPQDGHCWRWIRLRECYAFVGVTGRLVGFNAFLQGPAFHDGKYVTPERFVRDLSWGFRLRWDRIQVDYSSNRRSREFSPVPSTSAQRNGRHGFGAINLRCVAPLQTDAGRIDILCPSLLATLVAAVASR